MSKQDGDVEMLDKVVDLGNQNERVMATGAVAFFIYLHQAEKAASKFGLGFGDMIVLKHLDSRKDEIILRQLKDNIMMLSGASITKIIDKLFSLGYTERRENPDSRREKLVKITASGKPRAVTCMVRAASWRMMGPGMFQ